MPVPPSQLLNKMSQYHKPLISVTLLLKLSKTTGLDNFNGLVAIVSINLFL